MRVPLLPEWGKLMHLIGERQGCLLRGSGDPCEGPIEAHHLITRSRRYFKNDPRLGVALCRRHHTGSSPIGAHHRPAAFLKALPAPLAGLVERAQNYRGRHKQNPAAERAALREVINIINNGVAAYYVHSSLYRHRSLYPWVDLSEGK